MTIDTIINYPYNMIMRKLIIGAIISILSFASFAMALKNQYNWIASEQWSQSDFAIAVAFLISMGVIGLVFLLWGIIDVISNR